VNRSDSPRFFRAALTYHSEIGTFRGGRGAWRVRSSWVTVHQDSDIWVLKAKPWALFMDVPRLLRRNTFVNPTVLLKILLEQRRAKEGPCPKQQSGS
jgi:hypothetical protein